MHFEIKAMETEDERCGKAYVHWKSWQESYVGIVDPGYLSRLTLEKCEEIAFRFPNNTWVAVEDGRVIGFAAAGKTRGPGGQSSDEGEVYAIYVLEEFQKKKVGYRLMRYCLEQLAGCRKVYVWVLKENKKAISFYEQVGFRADGSEEELVLGTPVLAIRMTISN